MSTSKTPSNPKKMKWVFEISHYYGMLTYLDQSWQQQQSQKNHKSQVPWPSSGSSCWRHMKHETGVCWANSRGHQAEWRCSQPQLHTHSPVQSATRSHSCCSLPHTNWPHLWVWPLETWIWTTGLGMGAPNKEGRKPWRLECDPNCNRRKQKEKKGKAD